MHISMILISVLSQYLGAQNVELTSSAPLIEICNAHRKRFFSLLPIAMLVSLAAHLDIMCMIPKDTGKSRISCIADMTYLTQTVPGL